MACKFSVSNIFLCAFLCSSIVSLSSNTTNESKMPPCSRGFLTNSSSKYCIDPNATTRNWYRAMAECRSYGGELFSPENNGMIDRIRKQLNGTNIDLSQSVFVNAHKNLYWSNNEKKFVWKTGNKFNEDREVNIRSTMDECVQFFFQRDEKISFVSIDCGKDLLYSSLICEKESRRINFDGLMFPLAYNVSNKFSTYPDQQCYYSTYIHFKNVNWYQAKTYCESINSVLLGTPNNEECKLITTSASLFAGDFDLFLNVHLYLYSRNFSNFTFMDNYGNSIYKSPCNFSLKEFKNTELCLQVSPKKVISSSNCETDSAFKGFICKQCTSNSRIGSENMHLKEHRDSTTTDCKSLSSSARGSTPVSGSQPEGLVNEAPSYKQEANLHTADVAWLIYFGLIALSILLIIALSVALVLALRRIRRMSLTNGMSVSAMELMETKQPLTATHNIPYRFHNAGAPGALEMDTGLAGEVPLQTESDGERTRYSNLDPTYDRAFTPFSISGAFAELPAPAAAPPAVPPLPQSSVPIDRNSGVLY